MVSEPCQFEAERVRGLTGESEVVDDEGIVGRDNFANLDESESFIIEVKRTLKIADVDIEMVEM